MKYFIFFLFFFPSFLLSVDSIRISPSLDSLVLLDSAKILKDTEHLHRDEALVLLNQGKFDLLPVHVKSLGVSHDTYWVALKLQNTNPEKLFLEFQYNQLTQVDCFIFKENNLIHSAINGNAIKLKDREIKDFFVRFPVWESDTPLIYLFKITSNRPIVIALHMATKAELDYEKLKSIIVVTLFSGCLFLLLLFNFTLYFVFKVKEYLFFGIHLGSLWVFIMYINHYTFFIIQDFLWLNNVIKVLSVQGFNVALLLLSIYFLDIHHVSKLLVKITYFLCVISVMIFFCLGIYGAPQSIAFIAGIIIPLYCMILGFVALYRKVIFATLYLLGLCGFYSGVLLFWLMQIGCINVMTIGKNVLLLGSLWEMIIFTCMLILKIRLIKIEHNLMKFHMKEAEKERLYQSKYISMGRTIGNIAHQWKQPLNALGAILTNMKGSLILEPKVRKKNMVRSVDMSFEILQHLSETIDTFYSFLLKPYTHKSQFCVEEELASIQKMLDYSFQNAGIHMRFHISSNVYIEGNPNEFIQCIINILLNAKDKFYDFEQPNAWIDICVYATQKMCIVSIQDNAGGVIIEPIESIFAFNVTSKKESAGVGLFICKDIIENRFKGKIEVQNKDDGACFILSIPLLSSPNDNAS